MARWQINTILADFAMGLLLCIHLMLICLTVAASSSVFPDKLEPECGNILNMTIAVTESRNITFARSFRSDPVSNAEWSQVNEIIRTKLCGGDRYWDLTSTAHPNKYVRVYCSKQNESQTEFANLFQHLHNIFPLRALVLHVSYDNDYQPIINSAVFQPIRDRLIDLTIRRGQPLVTQYLGGVGVFSSLIRLTIEDSISLNISKEDFSRMPQIRMIIVR
ncbi:uncharacterized protein LOC129582608 [Paramacrobiotus metropolitanus]|uniref:uncharacterized protein LOC129582608 n=1 Tax=Paramacrobiotus metropolitanus TaxID=2943436 RepID=UPI002445A470|nr:uncharacterized protein LOC129582608 [Paramacrobiotus metropolitanus]